MSLATRVVVPKIQARLYRIHKNNDAIDREEEPQEIIFRELTNVKKANSEGRIKGLEHETTALFGGVMQLNIGEDFNNKIFEEVLSNDHLEVFYRDIGDPTALKNSSLFGKDFVTSFTQKNTEFARKPQFFGSIWKADHTEKPTSVNTQLNAWDYMRIMQYYNIPRGKGESTQVKYIEMQDTKKENKLIGSKGKIEISQVKIHSDLLDYMDHAIELYIGSMYNTPYATVMSPVVFGEEKEDLSIDFIHKDLDISLHKISTAGSNAGIRDSSIYDDYPNMSDISINHISRIDNALKIDEIIEKSISKENSLSIIRFMDAKLQIANGIDSNNEPIGSLFRVVGEIIAIDQFGLAKLLTGAIAYDHGLHQWYTPVVDFDPEYVKRMIDLQGTLHGDSDSDNSTIQPFVGKLVYVRFRGGEIRGDRTTVSRKDLHRIAIFNRDSFGGFMNFFSIAPEMNFYTISKYLNQGMGAGEPRNIMRKPEFLSLAVSIVNFPQSRSATPYTVFVDLRGVNTNRGIFELIRKGAEIPIGTGNDEMIKQLRTEYLKRSSSYSALLATAFKQDSKFISFMTNIPASYMRADIFTGSKFKTFSYDSLSIIRIIQILSSTMAGFPATNNPVQVGGGVGKFKTKGGDVFQNKASKIDNYPIFLANRVIIEPSIVFATKTDNRIYTGYQSVTRAADIREETQLKGYFFLRLRVGIRDQIIDKNDVEFKILLDSINDLSIIKGTAINHIFRLSFAENMIFLKNINAEERDKLTDDRNGISLIYKLGGQTDSASIGASPPELNVLTLQDMTQDATYDPLYNRSQVNRGVIAKANNSLELPIHNPEVGWANVASGPLLFNSGLVCINPVSRTNFKVQKVDIISGSDGHSLRTQEQLIGIRDFINITDLQQEIITLRKLSVRNNISYGEISTSRSDKSLFELIKVSVPFEVVFDDTSKYLKLVAMDEPQNKSLKQLLADLTTLDNMTELDMAWTLPLAGYVITNFNAADLTIENMRIDIVDLQGAIELFQDYMSSYSAVIFLDLLVKGIRYLLWTLSKSRFLGHVYLPADHVSYSKNWQDKLQDFLKSTKGGIEANIPIIQVGSSLIFDVSKKNLTQKSISVGGGLQSAINKLLKTPVNFAKQIITGATGHTIKSFNIDGDEAALIWYVSKKIVYIGKDSGYMMRLNMTEGSFDWTLFHREDTIMTRLSEFYLMNGMNNYMVSKGGT